MYIHASVRMLSQKNCPTWKRYKMIFWLIRYSRFIICLKRIVDIWVKISNISSSLLQEQLLAELERLQLELDQLRGRPSSSYSRWGASNLFDHLFKKNKGLVSWGMRGIFQRTRCVCLEPWPCNSWRCWLWRNMNSSSHHRAGSVSSLPSTLFRRSLPGSASELRYPQGGGSLPSSYSNASGAVVVRRAHRGRWGPTRDDGNKV